MSSEQELRNRIRDLERLNSELQDKLDAIYAIVAPEDMETEAAEESDDELIDIKPAN